MLDCLIVGAGGFVGSVLRYLAGKLPVKNPAGFPLTTLAINVLGSFIIGLVTAYAAKHGSFSPRLLLLIKVGLCGGFTTFSSFSLETVGLLRDGNWAAAALYVALSIALGLAAVAAGQWAVN